jgi:hypothetical protein
MNKYTNLPNMLFISKDGVNWAPLSGKNAVREVLGYGKLGTWEAGDVLDIFSFHGIQPSCHDMPE